MTLEFELSKNHVVSMERSPNGGPCLYNVYTARYKITFFFRIPRTVRRYLTKAQLYQAFTGSPPTASPRSTCTVSRNLTVVAGPYVFPLQQYLRNHFFKPVISQIEGFIDC